MACGKPPVSAAENRVIYIFAPDADKLRRFCVAVLALIVVIGRGENRIFFERECILENLARRGEIAHIHINEVFFAIRA